MEDRSGIRRDSTQVCAPSVDQLRPFQNDKKAEVPSRELEGIYEVKPKLRELELTVQLRKCY